MVSLCCDWQTYLPVELSDEEDAIVCVASHVWVRLHEVHLARGAPVVVCHFDGRHWVALIESESSQGSCLSLKVDVRHAVDWQKRRDWLVIFSWYENG